MASFLGDYLVDLVLLFSFLLLYRNRWRRTRNVYWYLIIVAPHAFHLVSHFSIFLCSLEIDVLLALVLFQSHFESFIFLVEVFHRLLRIYFELCPFTQTFQNTLDLKNSKIWHWGLITDSDILMDVTSNAKHGKHNSIVLLVKHFINFDHGQGINILKVNTGIWHFFIQLLEIFRLERQTLYEKVCQRQEIKTPFKVRWPFNGNLCKLTRFDKTALRDNVIWNFATAKDIKCNNSISILGNQ